MTVGLTGCRNDQGDGVSCNWEMIRQQRSKIRAGLKAIAMALPEKRIPSAKMVNKRLRKIIALVEFLDDFERDCPAVDWTRARELEEIYCACDRLASHTKEGR